MTDLVILGDLHGYAWEALSLVAAETETRGRPFDAVLCVGDVGVLRSDHPDDLDRATKKWAFRGSPEHSIPADPHTVSWPAEILREERPGLDQMYATIDQGGPPVPIYAVDGNHDDHSYLEELAGGREGSTYPVDPRGRWHMVRRGHAVTINGIRIVGCGGIRPPTKKKPKARHLLPDEYDRLASAGDCDIIITHEAPAGIEGIPGDEPLANAGLACKPRWWFYGHFHRKLGPVLLNNSETMAVGMGLFNQDFPNRPGVIGVLSLQKTDASWQWVL